MKRDYEIVVKDGWGRNKTRTIIVKAQDEKWAEAAVKVKGMNWDEEIVSIKLKEPVYG